MLDVLRPKIVTNPLCQKVDIFGGDDLFTQSGLNTTFTVTYTAGSLRCAYVRWDSIGGGTTRPRAGLSTTGIGGGDIEVTTPRRVPAFAFYQWGWFVMRRGGSVEVRDEDDQVVYEYAN